jgi:LysR family transcriptional regulator for metE and metH
MNGVNTLVPLALTLDVRDLSLVRAIADTGSVTHAGTRLHLTQSALSHRLRIVESRLGTPLFQRLGKRMVLTPAGERVLSSAHRVLDELGRAEDELRVMAHQGTGVLRLCTQCYTGYHWLPPLLRTFHDKHPRVDVRIAVEATYRPIDALLANEIDLAVLTASVEDRRLLVRPLFDDEMLIVVGPDHALASRAYIEPADLAGEHLLVYNSDRRDSFVFTQILEPAGVEPARVSRVPLTEAVIELVKAGMGVAVLARWAVEPAIAAGAVRALRITRHGFVRRWSAATLNGREEPRWMSDFVTLLRSSAPAPRRHDARSDRVRSKRAKAVSRSS